MKVGLVGFGKAGKAVASVLLQSSEVSLQWVLRKSHTLEHRSVPEFLGIGAAEPGFIYSTDEFRPDRLLDKLPVEVIIDFSSAAGVEYYGAAAAERGIAIISAISHYEPRQLEQLRQLARHTRVVWSPNITIGINFLMIAAKILKNIAPYTDIEVMEEHFKAKKEVSGTARKIATVLELPQEAIKTVRAGGIIGVHEILFGFPYQTVRLKHESITREAFGNGVLFAASHIGGREPGLYDMEDLLLPYFNVPSSSPGSEAGTPPARQRPTLEYS